MPYSLPADPSVDGSLTPMGRRWPALGLCVLVGAVSAGCTSEGSPPSQGLDRIVAGWEHDGELAPQEALIVARGAEHCDWTDVVFLQLARSPGDLLTPTNARQYIRDADGTLPAEYSAGLDLDAELPSDAERTGFVNEAGMELFVSQDGSAVYLVDESGATEAWPRADPATGCD
jgi:hypothetical protein